MNCSAKVLLKTVQVVIACLVILTGFLFVQRPALAETEGANVLFVLDGSGSMWGKINNKEKIVIAKEVLTELIKELPDDVTVGLEVYGHRRKGDCEDIELLVPPGKGNKDTLIKQIHSITPTGKTPLSEAVRRAAVELKYTEKRATVVLISDGKETCNVDPCAVGAELAMGGADFTAHVIGFDVKGEEQVGLRCLAENTGGLFLAAADAGSLREALFKTVEKAKAPPPPLVEEPGDASLKVPAEVPAGSVFEVSWEGPDSRNDFITIVDKNAPEGSYLDYKYTAGGNPVKIAAPEKVDTYEVRYVFGHTKVTLARADIAVTPVEASLNAPAEVAAGSNFKVEWKGPDNESDYITIVPANAAEGKYLSYIYTSSGNPVTLLAPEEPGAYEIRYAMGKSEATLARTSITVSPVSAGVEPPASVAAGASFEVHWKGPGNDGDYITIVPANAPEGNFLSYKYTNSGNPVTLLAPVDPGAYEIRYVLAKSRATLARAGITVSPISASIESPASVAAGSSFEVHWKGPNYDGDYITIVLANAPDNTYLSYAQTITGSPVTLQAPKEPGAYEVRYILNQSRSALARTPVTVK